MTVPAMIPTKINIPRPRMDVVVRPRIFSILDEGWAAPTALTLISAPAGSGKTTLLVNWLQNKKHKAAWFSLGDEDDLFPRFVSYVIAALQSLDPVLGRSAAKAFTSGDGQTPQSEAVINSLLRDCAVLEHPVALVLEDYHFIKSAEIHRLVAEIAEYLQPYLRLFITTRNDPPLPLAKWRVRHQLVEIRSSDLQFTAQETGEFLRRVMKVDLPAAELTNLQQQTEGWAAGLQLAALSLRSRKQQGIAWSWGDGNRDLSDYLMAEVLGQLPPEKQDFLMQTALVTRFSAALCNTLTGGNNAQALLDELDSENLFLVSLDDSREWFRFHHLFADFLQKQALIRYPAEAIRGLHQRAARWLAGQGYVTEAIEHALAAQDYEFAAALIGPQSQEWMRRGEVATILEKMKQLPDEIVSKNAGLCIWYGWVYALGDSPQLAERWSDRAEAVLSPDLKTVAADPEQFGPGIRNSHAQILAIRATAARHRHDFQTAVQLAEQALRIVPKGNTHLQMIISAGLSTSQIEVGDFAQADSVTSATRQLAYQTGHPFIEFSMLINEAVLAMARGQLYKAYQVAEDALHLADAESMQHLAFIPHGYLGEVNFLWNKLNEARQHILQGNHNLNFKEYPTSSVRAYLNLAMLHQAEGEFAQALDALEKARRFAQKHQVADLFERAKGLQALYQFSAGKTEAVERWAKSSGWDSFDPVQSKLLFNEESFYAACRYRIDLAKPTEYQKVEALLEWCLGEAEAQQRVGVILKVRLLQVCLYQVQGESDAALAALVQALTLAEPEKFIRPFLDAGELLESLLPRVPHSHSARAFAQTILTNFHTQKPQPMPVLLEPLNEQELGILRLMAQGFSNPEIAQKRALAVSTVRWYVKHIHRKLGVHNRTQAAARAREMDLL
ncbi:MAG TPA: LuxR C-terminal-related transcriptional regulator [Anaerolineales bacterium]|nr:LuxR C-terminal-related transcriptional regulator [Anaerolineales bacterium]